MSGNPLDSATGSTLRTASGEFAYPVVDGIPILLRSEEERQRVSETDWEQHAETEDTALDFYNRPRDHDHYCRESLEELAIEIRERRTLLATPGPSLEIGSGKGSLQGIGEPYVALDYSLTALRRYIRPEHQRVCASAEELPFFDASFTFVYSVASLEHVHRPDLAFREVHRVLSPGGVAFLLPAWHCVRYNCDGIPVRPYTDLTVRQKLVKASLPLRQNIVAKAAAALPGRLVRRLLWERDRYPTELRYRSLRPDYSQFWMSDSDAASRLDSHEATLFFRSRGYEIASPGPGPRQQLLARHQPLVVRKP